MEERFSEPEPNVIQSSAGFSVRILGQTGMRTSKVAGRLGWIRKSSPGLGRYFYSRTRSGLGTARVMLSR
jgi:hypothetical protein